MKKKSGFTLLESLLSITILAIVALSISYAFSMGFKSSDEARKEMEKLSYARGMMEVINAVDFSNLTSGTDTVSIQGEVITRTWSVLPCDLDGDSIPENDARKVIVTVDSIKLQSIVIDSKNLVTMKR
ncbi:MAG: prepilin-type N-terminal cleavage/methylation domain-containing protein [Candidatus Schekmanbacteria bacterium]|nr:MAG: prepilin-type N-terminal cleavage/methylation domain-containing protein [Candidatus Schekmanbacteria bacterium]